MGVQEAVAMKQKLILASASPRRAAILKQLGIPFEVQVSQVQEENVQALFICRLSSLR